MIKQKKCKYCKELFLPKGFNQKNCFKDECISLFYNENKKKIELKSKQNKTKVKKELKESLKSISSVINDVKKVFQKYVRLRDKDKPCISCGNKNPSDWCGSHFFPAGVYSGLIFDERNCHGACNTYCNMYLSGNLVNYRIGLIERYGEKYVLALEQDSLKAKSYKYTREELNEIKEKYKQKIKEYENN